MFNKGTLITPAEGPLVFVHEYDDIVAPFVPVPEPVNVTELTGNVIVCAVPALATGGVFAGVVVPVFLLLLKNHSYILGLAVKLPPPFTVVVI